MGGGDGGGGETGGLFWHSAHRRQACDGSSHLAAWCVAVVLPPKLESHGHPMAHWPLAVSTSEHTHGASTTPLVIAPFPPYGVPVLQKPSHAHGSDGGGEGAYGICVHLC